jgi:hypothetical protein
MTSDHLDVRKLWGMTVPLGLMTLVSACILILDSSLRFHIETETVCRFFFSQRKSSAGPQFSDLQELVSLRWQMFGVPWDIFLVKRPSISRAKLT